MDLTDGRTLSLPALSKGYCKACGDHVLTLNRDVHFEEYVDQFFLDDKEGQGPWCVDEKMECRKCTRSFWPLPIGLDWK